jgi:hypothetical protein
MSWTERIFLIGFGMLSIAGSCQKVVYMSGPMPGKKDPPTHIATPVGRACFFILGVMCIFVGSTGITEFWYFKR